MRSTKRGFVAVEPNGRLLLRGHGISGGVPGGLPRGSRYPFIYEGTISGDRYSAKDIAVPRPCTVEMTRLRSGNARSGRMCRWPTKPPAPALWPASTRSERGCVDTGQRRDVYRPSRTSIVLTRLPAVFRDRGLRRLGQDWRAVSIPALFCGFAAGASFSSVARPPTVTSAWSHP